MKNVYEELSCGNDVLFTKDGILIDHPMYKVLQMLEVIKEAIRQQESQRGRWAEQDEDWFNEGTNCEILKIGSKGWKTGKVRIKISLEFCPNESVNEEEYFNEKLVHIQEDSPLDDIRQAMTEES